MWDVRACRSCLTVKGKLEKIGEASKKQYTAVTGLQFSESDGYPNYFCVVCRHHIRKSLAFRRRSRRAHFVLKEIMSIRKQVTYSDIVTVNRKRANLESSLDFWEPHSSACFLIADPGPEGQEGLQKYDLQHTQSHSNHLVEIKPDAVETPEELTPVDTATHEDNDNDTFTDIPTNDYLEPEMDPNIDMNDIFKDLDENLSEDEDATPTTENKVDDVKVPRNQFSVDTLVSTLVQFDIKALTLEEQKEKMELRRNMHPFLHSPYKCAICLTIHRDMQELIEHVHYHNKRLYEHECQVCKNKLPTVEELDKHMVNCHLYQYQCRICRAKIYSQADAVRHSKTPHTGSMKLYPTKRRQKEVLRALRNYVTTPLTQQMMSRVMELRRSEPRKIKRKPSGIGRFKCDVCSAWFKWQKNLERHMIRNHRYMFTCKLCKEVLTTQDEALQHNLTHDKNFECEECGLIFDQNKTFKEHRATHHTGRTPCNMCGLCFRTKKLYYKHQLKQHGHISINDPLLGDPQHKCTTCDVQFTDRRALETHLVKMKHEGADAVPFACVPCKKLYEDDEQLETHFITCPSARRYPRKCCYCSEMLHNSLEYQQHYLYSHPTLQYRYLTQNCICDICGKSIFKPQLETHLKSHVGGAYLCRLCDTTNPTPAMHLAHVLSCHACRPYRCAVCSKGFKHRSDCRDHILRIHAPTKLYKCEFCGVEFSYFGHLQDHSKSLHNLVLTYPKSKFQFKSKNKLFVYAHMKIEISELERHAVEKANIELIDYLEQKSKPVHYSDYFIFNTEAEETAVYKKQKRRGPKKAKAKSELESAVAQIKLKWNDFGGISVMPEQSDIHEQSDVNEQSYVPELSDIAEQSEILESDIGDKVNDESAMKNDESAMKNDESAMKGDNIEETKAGAMEVDNSTPLEVIENDGHQFVMIDGEMYRIAGEDELED